MGYAVIPAAAVNNRFGISGRRRLCARRRSRVATVMTAALHASGEPPARCGDASFRVLTANSDLRLGISPNFDRSGWLADTNVIFLLDRLAELARDGMIGSVAPRHLALAGNPQDRSYAERIRPPWALYCAFPLGRPLGKPGDPVFQRRVVEAALKLLERPEGPVLADFPERIEDGSAAPPACTLPLRFDPHALATVAEARGLRPTYERQLSRSGRAQPRRRAAPSRRSSPVGCTNSVGSG